MNLFVKLSLTLVVLLGFTANTVVAEGELTCGPGQKKVSFADGNNITEVCIDFSDMEQTVPNSEAE